MSKAIAVVEDDESIREMLRYYFQSVGYAVRAYESGEALFAGEEGLGLPALYILDIMLPGMDGLEILRRLLPVFRAHDGRRHTGRLQQPGDGSLGRRLPVLGAGLCQHVRHLQGAVVVLRLEQRGTAAPVREGGSLLVLPGQQPLGQGAVGDDRDIVFTAELQ